MNRTVRLSAPALCFSVLMAACTSQESAELSDPEKNTLMVLDAWQPGGPAVVAVSAGYLVLENRSSQTQIVIGASSTQYESVTLHRTSIEDSVSRMEPVSFLEVAAGERMVFEPEGLHLMLRAPKAALSVDQEFRLTFYLKGGAEVPFTMRVVETRCARCGVSSHGDDHFHVEHDH